ncbi:hypothetical protein ACNCR0_004809 [Escherichia coli]|uniref:hypothetical protein n=1 Tax=Escherichia coli TaxID=562 RepID=UPI0013EA6E3A|nr:hypothetical protein [Escherichia coli]MCU9684634.1 hypothetical protein [Escherichia coli]
MAVIVKADLSKIPSISGNNGYSLRCEEVKINGESAYCSYSVCQHTILAFKENRLPRTSFQSCATAIKAGKCKALKMMVEEIRKGESLYFADMTALIKEVEERNKQSRSIKRKRDSVTINSMVKKSATSQTAITDVYAALLEETTKETHEQIDQHMEAKQQ